MPPPPLPPAQPSPPLPPPSVKHAVLTLTASGSFSDYLDSRKSLKRKFADAAGVDKLLVTMRTRRGAKNQSAAASMLITVTIAVPVSMSADEVQTSLLFTLGTADAASTVLGVTIEEVLIVTVRAEPPSPPPPSPTPPPPPPPESPPALPPAPPRPPSTPSAGGGANSQVPVEALWALLPLCVLLVAALVLLYRYRYRLLRDRANAVLSRDRLHIDLQMSVHVVHTLQRAAMGKGKGKEDGSIVSSQSQTEQNQTWETRSLPDSLPAKRMSRAKTPTASLPPGPPSSASGVSEDNQHVLMSNIPRPGMARTIAHSMMPFASAKRPAPSESAAAPRSKKAYKTPYTIFCQEQRPHLPTSLYNSDREKTLGQMWTKLSAAEKAKYKPVLIPAPPPAPTAWCGYNSSLAPPKRRAPLPTATVTTPVPMQTCKAPTPTAAVPILMPTAAVPIPMPTTAVPIPVPTTAEAIPVPTGAAVAISAPDLTRSTAPAPSAAPTLMAAVATPAKPLAPPALTTGTLRPPEPQREATPPWTGPAVKLKLGPPTLTAPPIPTAPPTPSTTTKNSELQRLTAVAMVALKRMGPRGDDGSRL